MMLQDKWSKTEWFEEEAKKKEKQKTKENMKKKKKRRGMNDIVFLVLQEKTIGFLWRPKQSLKNGEICKLFMGLKINVIKYNDEIE